MSTEPPSGGSRSRDPGRAHRVAAYNRSALLRISPTIVALAVIGATTAAFAVTEHLKLERAPITAPRFTRDFSPVCDCPTDRARLSLRFRRSDVVDSEIVDAGSEPIRSLARDRSVGAGVVTFVWDGRDDAGRIAPDGAYRLRLHLDREARTILVPTTIELDTKPPRILALRHRPDVISPDGDGRADRLRVRYRSSERASARLLVEASQVVRTPFKRARRPQSLQWLGTVPAPGAARMRTPAEPGMYELTFVLVDPAGNRVERAFPVTVRYVELDRTSYEVRPGGMLEFRVDADARRYAWSLSRRTQRGLDPPLVLGEATPGERVSVEIPASAPRGRYELRVAVGDNSDRARVFVSERAP